MLAYLDSTLVRGLLAKATGQLSWRKATLRPYSLALVWITTGLSCSSWQEWSWRSWLHIQAFSCWWILHLWSDSSPSCLIALRGKQSCLRVMDEWFELFDKSKKWLKIGLVYGCRQVLNDFHFCRIGFHATFCEDCSVGTDLLSFQMLHYLLLNETILAGWLHKLDELVIMLFRCLSKYVKPSCMAMTPGSLSCVIWFMCIWNISWLI